MRVILCFFMLITIGGCDWSIPENKSVFAITQSWSFSGNSSTTVSKTVSDNANNIYILGNFTGVLSQSSRTSRGGQDIYLVKFNADQVVQWVANIGSSSDDSGNGIAIDPSGNILITGAIRASASFFNGNGVIGRTINSQGGKDAFIAKYSTNGDLLWATNVGGTGDDEGYGIATDKNSNVYFTGSFFDLQINFYDAQTAGKSTPLSPRGKTVANTDIVTAKFTSNGELRWAKEANSPTSSTGSDVGLDIVTDNDGAVYITGLSWGRRAPGTSEGSNDIFVIKYSTDGAPIWDKGYGSIWDDLGTSLIMVDGAVYVTGYFGQNANAGQANISALNLTSTGKEDAFVLKLNAQEGNIIWAQALGGSDTDVGTDLTVDNNGNVFAIGYFKSNVLSSPKGNGKINLQNKGGNDIFICMLGSDGSVLNLDQISSSSDEEGRGIMMYRGNEVVGVGTFRTSLMVGNKQVVNKGNVDVLLFKYQ